MKEYLVKFYPLQIFVKAENKNEAEENAITEIISGELQYEVKEIEETKEEKNKK